MSLSARLDAEQPRSGDDGISVVYAGKIGPSRISQVLVECLLVGHLDELNLDRVVISAIDDTVPCQEHAAVIGQQGEYRIFEGSKIVSASGTLPKQDAQA